MIWQCKYLQYGHKIYWYFIVNCTSYFYYIYIYIPFTTLYVDYCLILSLGRKCTDKLFFCIETWWLPSWIHMTWPFKYSKNTDLLVLCLSTHPCFSYGNVFLIITFARKKTLEKNVFRVHPYLHVPFFYNYLLVFSDSRCSCISLGLHLVFPHVK